MKDQLARKDGMCRVCGRSLDDYATGAHDECGEWAADVQAMIDNNVNPDGTLAECRICGRAAEGHDHGACREVVEIRRMLDEAYKD